MKNTAELTKILASCYGVTGDILRSVASCHVYPDLYDTVFSFAQEAFKHVRRAEDEYNKDPNDNTEAKRALKSLLDIFQRIQESEQMYFEPKKLSSK